MKNVIKFWIFLLIAILFSCTAVDFTALQNNPRNNPLDPLNDYSIPTNGMVLQCLFTGGSLLDTSGNGNNISQNNCIMTNDRFGSNNNAYYFNGTNSGMSMPDIRCASNFTFSCWYCAGTNTNFSQIFSAYVGGDFISLHVRSYDPGSNPVFQYWICYTNSYEFLESGVTVNKNQWYHLVFIHNFQDRSASFYINNTLVDKENNRTLYPYMLSSQGNTTCELGDIPVQGFNIDGIIDDVRIYQRALSAQDVRNLYYEGNTDHP